MTKIGIRWPTVAFAATLCGCGGHRGVEVRQLPGLKFENTQVDLGVVSPEKKLAAVFKFRNDSAAPMQVYVKHASCSCIDAVVIPKGRIKSGGSGEVRAMMSFEEYMRGGEVSGDIYVVANDSKATEKLSMRGIIEGFSGLLYFPDGVYVIRRLKSTDKPPNLNFKITFARPNAKVVIVSIRSEKDSSRANATAQNVLLPRVIEADMNGLQISEPHRTIGDIGYEVVVKVPIKLSPNAQQTRGRFIINYSINGVPRQQSVIYLVITKAPSR